MQSSVLQVHTQTAMPYIRTTHEDTSLIVERCDPIRTRTVTSVPSFISLFPVEQMLMSFNAMQLHHAMKEQKMNQKEHPSDRRNVLINESNTL